MTTPELHAQVAALQLQVSQLEALLDLSATASRQSCMRRTVQASVERDDANYRVEVLKRAYLQSKASMNFALLEFMFIHIDDMRAPEYEWMRLECGEADLAA